MELGMVGLGRMGANMVERLLNGGHRPVVYDIKRGAVEALVRKGAIAATSLDGLVRNLASPRVVWLMLPAGEATETTADALSARLTSGDILFDGSNSNYNDSMRRAAMVSSKGITLLDAGISGGIWGLKDGYCLMVGGDVEAFKYIEPLLQTLAPSPERGYGHVGLAGSGHFVKMVHNGIEYGLMEAYAEGFELLQAKRDFRLDLHKIAQIWRDGSVIRSWLLDLTAAALRENSQLAGIEPYVEDTGEGRWTVQESLELAVPMPAITQSLLVRFRSRQEQPFSGRLLAALRKIFGGHSLKETRQ